MLIDRTIQLSYVQLDVLLRHNQTSSGGPIDSHILAFFPLFIDPAQHQGLLTFGVMALTIAALTFLYGLGAVLLTHFLWNQLGYLAISCHVPM